MTKILSDNKVSSMHLVTKITYLYNLGNEYVDLTGGWGRNADMYGTVTKNMGNIYLQSTSNNASVCICTLNSVDLTDFTKLMIDASFDIYATGAGISGFGIGDVSLNDAYEYYYISDFTIAYNTLAVGSYARQIKELDISGVSSGFPFVAVYKKTEFTGNECTFYKMWLE